MTWRICFAVAPLVVLGAAILLSLGGCAPLRSAADIAIACAARPSDCN